METLHTDSVIYDGLTRSNTLPKASDEVLMQSDEADMLALINQVRQAIAVPTQSNADRAQLIANISRLQLAVESPLETIYRIGHQSWQNACVRIALDLGIFDTLVGKDGLPLDIQVLASTCDSDPVFLGRIMRVIVALGLCAELGIEEYQANAKTKMMTTSQGITSFKFWLDIASPTASKLPGYMHSIKYQNPIQSATSAFAYTNGSEFWHYLSQTPEHSAIFNEFMATRRQGRRNWYDIYPIDQELSSPSGQTDVLLVDVGGNRGHDLMSIKAKNPGLVGRMILQDLPNVVARTSFGPDSGITAMGHDFFEPQPVFHARAYHFRAIFHDWPDSSCQQILTHTAAAMKPDYSKLLISEFVLTDTDTALFPATLDIQMMGLHAGMERSEKQWRGLLDSAGLEVVKIWQEVKGGEGVIEATLKKSV
ncbi:MAG: hypothetical protein Q9170_004946 [Blastenia crenularia]